MKHYNIDFYKVNVIMQLTKEHKEVKIGKSHIGQSFDSLLKEENAKLKEENAKLKEELEQVKEICKYKETLDEIRKWSKVLREVLKGE